jgi:predicted membrane chloride channel (bestrophin family)
MLVASVIDLLKRSLTQRLAFALLVLVTSALLVAFRRIESSGFVTLMLGVVAAFFGSSAFDKWVEGQKS